MNEYSLAKVQALIIWVLILLLAFDRISPSTYDLVLERTMLHDFGKNTKVSLKP